MKKRLKNQFILFSITYTFFYFFVIQTDPKFRSKLENKKFENDRNAFLLFL